MLKSNILLPVAPMISNRPIKAAHMDASRECMSVTLRKYYDNGLIDFDFSGIVRNAGGGALNRRGPHRGQSPG